MTKFIMKRKSIILALVTISSIATFAQNIEYPACYAMLDNGLTMKHRLAYQESNFYTCFRLIQGSTLSFKEGDQIEIVTTDGSTFTYTITSEMVASTESQGYCNFETDYSTILHYQTGMKSMYLIRDGARLECKQTQYSPKCFQDNANSIIRDEHTISKQRARLAVAQETASIRKQTAEEYKDNPIAPSYGRVYIGYTPTVFSYKGSLYDHYEGIELGMTNGFRLSRENRLYLEAGLRFNYLRQHVDETWGDITDQMLSLSIPINISTRIELGKSGACISPFVGPYLKWNMMAKETNNDTDKSISYLDEDEVGRNAVYKDFQIGGQLGINVDYSSFYMGVVYRIDFTKVSKILNHTRGLAFRIGLSY